MNHYHINCQNILHLKIILALALGSFDLCVGGENFEFKKPTNLIRFFPFGRTKIRLDTTI